MKRIQMSILGLLAFMATSNMGWADPLEKTAPIQEKHDVIPGDGCAETGEANQILSPACLDSLKILRGPASSIISSANNAVSSPLGGRVTCSIAVYNGNETITSMAITHFEAPSAQRCLGIGAGLGYGITGRTIIILSNESYITSITCHRNQNKISCEKTS